jgi:hypothetical protein
MQTKTAARTDHTEQENEEYLKAFRSGFSGVLRWEQLDKLWATIRNDASTKWYIYAIGEQPPATPSSTAHLDEFLSEIDKLLRKEHKEDYCGIVYTDSFDTPSFIKIYDPNNLGVVCGFSNNPPLPGWILSKIKPVDLKTAIKPPGNRRRWWQKLFNT